MEIKNFLKEAKVNGYGSNSPYSNTYTMGEDTTVIVYSPEESSYEYEDRYTGNEVFFGREIVTEKEDPLKTLYTMTYGGKEIKSFKDYPDIGKCLASALKAGAEAGLPRGPVVGFYGDYKYVSNTIYYNDDFFTGHEEIVDLITGEIVFTCNYQGGIPKK